MGHERTGTLPRTVRWRAIVNTMAGLPDDSATDLSSLAGATLKNVQSRFRLLHADTGVQAAFSYLISLATAHLPRSSDLASPPTALDEDPSPIKLAADLRRWVRQHASSYEQAELAIRAATDVIAEWTRSRSSQRQLFDDSVSAASVWSAASTGQGFCEVARSFFSHFTERYLRYFLEREASAVIPSVDARNRFNKNLHDHLDAVSRHAFETSKITQSFAAGWFNKHARNARPTDREIAGFLAVAFGKLYEELRREATE